MRPVWDVPARQDDALLASVTGEMGSSIQLVGDKAVKHLHELPEDWLRARVRGWMELCESPDLAYWIGTYKANGTWISCSSQNDAWTPTQLRQTYAQDVCRHLNRQCNFGGAWLAGWFRGGREFYLLWKDPDGDIQIPIECDKPMIALLKWKLTDWERQACTAHAIWHENFQKMNEIRPGKDTVKVAQGEKTSPAHLSNAPA